MAGAISGAFLGHGAIPPKWLDAVREEGYTVCKVAGMADRLFEKFGTESPDDSPL
jgi:hypothetical protein